MHIESKKSKKWALVVCFLALLCSFAFVCFFTIKSYAIPAANAKVSVIDKDYIRVNLIEHSKYQFNDGDYVTEDFLDINGNREEKVSVFGLSIDYIQYERDDQFSEPRWVFDTENVKAVIVEIYDSHNPEGTRVQNVIGNTSCSTTFVTVKKDIDYDTIDFRPCNLGTYAKVSSIDKYSIILDLPYRYPWQHYTNGDWISYNFIDINGNEEDKVSAFNQVTDWIKYEEIDGKSYFTFDTEGAHGVVCRIYNSKNKSSTTRQHNIGLSATDDVDRIEIDKNVTYDKIEFIPIWGCVTKIDSESIIVKNFGNRLYDEPYHDKPKTWDFSAAEYVCEDFFDINGHEEEKLSVFGQKIDWIQCEVSSAFGTRWRFDTEGINGVIVKLYNSKDKEGTLREGVIGRNDNDTDTIDICNETVYDTMEFVSYSAKVVSQSSSCIKVHLPWMLFNDGDYVACNFTDIYGKEEEEITVFGQRIDWIKYGFDDAWAWGEYKYYFEFDTEGTHGVKVKIYNSAAPEKSAVEAEIGTDWWSSTDKVLLNKDVFGGYDYDIIEFYPL